MGTNEKPATYPPGTQEKQKVGNQNEQDRLGNDLESGRRQQEGEDDDDEQMDELEGGLGEHAFHHPALYKPQVSSIVSRLQGKAILMNASDCSPRSGYHAMS